MPEVLVIALFSYNAANARDVFEMTKGVADKTKGVVIRSNSLKN